MRWAPLVVLAASAAACTREPPSVSTSQAPPRAAPLLLGEPISAQTVALADVARDPRAFEGHPLSTSGTVTAVCQNMGCWMEIRDASGNAHVRMHGHSFFVPKAASGRHARVQATVVPKDDAKECDEAKEQGGSAAGVARVELDATGVELD